MENLKTLNVGKCDLDDFPSLLTFETMSLGRLEKLVAFHVKKHLIPI
jgi:hypothetical protein